MFSELQTIRNHYATVSCYSIWYPTSDITHACDHFHSLYTMTALQIAQKINDDNVNILIDVNVVDTRNPWKVVLAHRPAPIQVRRPNSAFAYKSGLMRFPTDRTGGLPAR
jgi:hypothetical protein